MAERAPAPAPPDDRVGAIACMVERLLLDLARHGRGESVSFDYVDRDCATRLQDALALMPQTTAVLEADYGDSVAGTAHIGNEARPVAVDVVIQDRSALRHRDGRREDLAAARWLVALQLDPSCARITDLRVRSA